MQRQLALVVWYPQQMSLTFQQGHEQVRSPMPRCKVQSQVALLVLHACTPHGSGVFRLRRGSHAAERRSALAVQPQAWCLGAGFGAELRRPLPHPPLQQRLPLLLQPLLPGCLLLQAAHLPALHAG
jgi:hypothetical protein